jgi:enoyl-CoA hydratase/carnithine racemase
MLMHCDLVVAARHARFQLPFVSLGLSPEGASSQLLPLMAGPRVAAELLMLGDTFDATRAREIGLVNWVVDDNQLLPFAHEIATRLANQPADALRTTKRLLQRSWARTVSEVLDDERPEFERLLHSPAARSVFQAFLDKRSG